MIDNSVVVVIFTGEIVNPFAYAWATAESIYGTPTGFATVPGSTTANYWDTRPATNASTYTSDYATPPTNGDHIGLIVDRIRARVLGLLECRSFLRKRPRALARPRARPGRRVNPAPRRPRRVCVDEAPQDSEASTLCGLISKSHSQVPKPARKQFRAGFFGMGRLSCGNGMARSPSLAGEVRSLLHWVALRRAAGKTADSPQRSPIRQRFAFFP